MSSIKKSNIKVIPMMPIGGDNVYDKLKHIVFFPLHILRLRPYLKKTEMIHFRAPTGFGVLFLPWVYLFWVLIWVKYAGSKF